MLKKKKKYRLKILFQEIDLEPGEFIIGRSSSCNLTLEDPLVSRRHVMINISDSRATICDLGSRNGTLLNGEPVFEGKLSSLKRFKDDAREVTEGIECGIALSGFDDIKEGDTIEAYEIEKIARKL